MISQTGGWGRLSEISETAPQKGATSRFRIYHYYSLGLSDFYLEPCFSESCTLLPSSGKTVEVVPDKFWAQRNWLIRTILIRNLATYFRGKKKEERRNDLFLNISNYCKEHQIF